MDTLDYVPSNLENIPDAVFVEGKNDFYLFSYFESLVLNSGDRVKFLPGIGASGLDTLIALYLGWGRNFIIILDDDREGRKNRDRYIKDWLLPTTKVFTLRDVSQDWEKRQISFYRQTI